MPATQQDLRTILKEFVQGRSVDKNKVRQIILDSWTRSSEKNVDFRQEKTSVVLDGADLESHKARYSRLLTVCTPIMEKICSFLKSGGFIVSVFDTSGILLKVIGDPQVVEFSAMVNFVEGACWAEDIAGTNAVGTCLVRDEPMQVFGREHYRRTLAHCTCSAAPIHGTDGKIIGGLDITGPHDKAHSHTLGMVVTAVRDIEAQLRHIEILHSLELSDNYKNTIIDSISEGLLAVDEKGLVTHVNDTAVLSVGGDKAKIVGRYLWQLIPAKKNKTLFNLLKKGESVTDYELNLFTDRTKIGCLYTSRPIKIAKKSVGTVMLFSEVERARRLVLRMSGGEARLRFSDIIGQDPRFLETIEVAKKSAGSQSNMLILGESGSGKDILAQAIHNASSQCSGPFVAVNCSSIPRELIASEMFGYAGGAFTDASRGGRPGKFELADGGTLFLDEIGEMPLELQTLLLRSLETRTITRLGDNTSIPINVRIIAATNKDLYAEVFKKNFRRNLFYRLNVITIHMPPLRERKSDIVPLANHFLARLSKIMRKNHVKRIDPKVMCILSDYHWPGNIRELQNVIERALNVCTEPVICLDCLPPELRNNNTSNLGKPVDYYERVLIQTLMEKNNKNISKVAREIGLSRATLYRKIVKYKALDPA